MKEINLKIKKAIKNSGRALKYLVYGESAKQEKIYELLSDNSNDKKIVISLEQYLSISISEYLSELENSFTYKKILKEISKKWKNLGVFGMTESRMLYAICRALRPQIILETGVASGLSSSMFLLAIKKNKMGRLMSIDLPPNIDLNNKIKQFTLLPEDKKTGWLVPEDLKKNWQLKLGDAKKILPEILKETKNIDLFLHDSDHSYEHMKWEFEIIWPQLTKLLISDDISKNSAFSEFSLKTTSSFKISDRLGIIKK